MPELEPLGIAKGPDDPLSGKLSQDPIKRRPAEPRPFLKVRHAELWGLMVETRQNINRPLDRANGLGRFVIHRIRH